MNWDQIAGNWKQAKGKVREQWGKLTDDDIEVIAGKRDQLIGRVQERYGVAKEKAEEEVKNWEKLYQYQRHQPRRALVERAARNVRAPPPSGRRRLRFRGWGAREKAAELRAAHDRLVATQRHAAPSRAPASRRTGARDMGRIGQHDLDSDDGPVEQALRLTVTEPVVGDDRRRFGPSDERSLTVDDGNVHRESPRENPL